MRNSKTILVTGANGQLGMSINAISSNYPNYQFYFKNSTELDITKEEQIDKLFSETKFDYCINCAAYTAVDKAETDEKNAYLVNADAVKFLAKSCKVYNTVLIHISTDFVFDGTKDTPYTEEDQPNPINVYGASKLKGEQYVQEILEQYFIIRTSWVYSEYGNNFVKTMLRLGKERDEISVINDQVGCPTYAGDLAEVIMKIINSNTSQYGLYHYSNEGATSWYDFAKAIIKESDIKITLNPISIEEYPTPAKRPKQSILDKSKLKKTYKFKFFQWRTKLKKTIEGIYKNYMNKSLQIK